MFSLIFTFYIVQLSMALILRHGAKKTVKYLPLLKPELTSIIIPFKNEADRLKPLIYSINKAAIKHKKEALLSQLEFVFVDDHSTDDSVDMILNELDIPFKIIKCIYF